jgi:hypothetical protein
MAKPPSLKMPKPATPKAEIAPMRAPVKPAGGKDIISITTRMRETPMKKGR